MAGGTVKWFDQKKGYGFIQRNDGSDIFVHYSDIESEGFKLLHEGDNVEFELSQGDIGPKAAKVKTV
jgi:CspA family cold shock protein